jgi:hypothetical protein
MGQGLGDTFLGGPFSSKLPQGVRDTQRTEKVHLDGPVQGRVECHGRGSVNDDVTRPEHGSPSFVERKPVSSHVPANRVKTPGDHFFESIPELPPEAVEAVVAENLPSGPFGGPLTLPGAHEHDDFAFGHAAKQSLHKRCSEEARRSGHGDSPAGELVGYHESVSSTRVPKSLTTPAAQMAR